MATIRQEISFGATTNASGLRSAASGATATSQHMVNLDTTKFNGATYYFEIVADTSVSISSTVTLRRSGTSTDDATCSIPTLTTAPTLIRSSSFTPPAGATDYVFFITSGVGGTTIVFAARIIVIQNASITDTETQIELGPDHIVNGVSTSSATFVTGADPKYWKYTSANWDGTITAFFEVVWACVSTKVTATAELQVADGTGDGFAGFAAVGSDLTLTSTTITRTRSAAVTLTAGRNYRVVYKTSNSKTAVTLYNARMVIDQTASPTKIEAQYLLNGCIFSAGTGLQKALTKWDSTEWSGVTNTYTFCCDAANGSTSVIEADTAAGTQITGSVVTSPDNQGFSSSMTMPSNGNLDCKATTNNSDIAGARILVACVITLGDVTVTPTGSSATFSIGTPMISGGAAFTITGSSATFSSGTVTVTPRIDVFPTGSAGTFSIGTPTITGGATVSPTGSAATFSSGSPVISGSAAVSPTGNFATFSSGTVTVTIGGDVTVSLTGLLGTFSIGTPTITGGASVFPTGSQAVFSIGTVTVTGTGGSTFLPRLTLLGAG